MGIRDLVAQQATKAKQFVTGRPSQPSDEQKFPEEAHGQLAKVEVPNEESRASQVAKATKSFINRQTSSTFKSAIGYKQTQSKQPKAGKIKKPQDNVVGNIPHTRVPVEPQKASFINRQIDLSYNQGQGYTSNIVNEAFRWRQFENKPQKNITGLPSLRGTFENAVGYKPEKEKKVKTHKFVFVIKREPKKQ